MYAGHANALACLINEPPANLTAAQCAALTDPVVQILPQLLSTAVRAYTTNSEAVVENIKTETVLMASVPVTAAHCARVLHRPRLAQTLPICSSTLRAFRRSFRFTLPGSRQFSSFS